MVFTIELPSHLKKPQTEDQHETNTTQNAQNELKPTYII